MKKSTLTEDKAEKTPTGGVLVGKREGQTIIHNKGTLSGYLVGKTHANGGIKAVNKSTGQPLEMQGGEVVITAPAVSDNTKREFEGKMMTNREILSTINENGGGVAFAKDGMEIPKRVRRTGASYNYGGKTMTDHEIYRHITKRQKQNFVRDSKSGNTPARDLNNYNDVLDLQADNMVGADNGLFADGGLIAPNGNKSNLTPEQYKLVRTPEFKAWFGDWENDPENASKVVDENGEPLVVYHGTYVENPFYIFDFDKADLGFHFGTYEQAKNRSETKLFFKGRKSIVNSFFLNIKTIFESTDIGEWEYPQRYIDMFVSDGLISESDAKKNGFYRLVQREENKQIREYLLNKYGKFGGFVYNNKYEGKGNSFIVLNPNQIKLADGSNTTFDGNNPDIRYADGGMFNTEPFLNYYFDEIAEFLKYQNNITLNKDFTFKYKGELFRVEPIVLSEKNIKEAYFSIIDSEDEEVGDIVFNPNNNKKFEANSDFFDWNNIKFYDGGDVKPYDANMEGDSADMVFDEGGETDLPKVQYLIVSGTTNSLKDLRGEKFYSFKQMKDAIASIYKNYNQDLKASIYFTINGEGIVGGNISSAKNTVNNFNPYTGKASDLEKQFIKKYKWRYDKYNWKDWYGVEEQEKTTRSNKTTTSTPTSTPSTNDKPFDFSMTKIDVSNNPELSVKVQKKAFEDGWEWENGGGKTIDYNKFNYLYFTKTSISYGNSNSSFSNSPKKEITEADIFGAQAPTSNNESKAIEITSVIIKYYNDKDFELTSIIYDVLDLKKQFDTIQKLYTNKFVRIYPVENGNDTGSDSRLYLTSTPSEREDFNSLDSTIVNLSAKLEYFFQKENYNWSKFFNVSKTSQTNTPTTPEPVKSKRNYELERKYLTGRINDLSKELDMKRPSLANEEIAFYQREINKFVLKLRKVMNDQNEEKPITERIEAVYGLKWGEYDKQYPETNLVAYNGVKSELTDEEYLTVRTPEFKAFFGDWEQGNSAGYSKVINPKTKEPMAVYHGTNVLFTEWKTYATNNAHYFAVKRDFSEFFASEWENRTDRAGVDSKVLKDLNPNKGKFMYRCFIDVRNPIDFSRFGVDKRPISDYLTFLKINYNIGDYDFWTGLGNASGVTKDTKVYAWQIIRLWQNFTTYVKLYTTYDGYIFYEYNPNTPTGGIENASLCYCAFESNQVKFTNAYEFNALSNDSRFDFGGTI